MNDDDLRDAIKSWYEETYPGHTIQDFAVVASGQTLEQIVGDGDEVGSAWSWLTGRGQLPHRTSGLLQRFRRAVDRDNDTE